MRPRKSLGQHFLHDRNVIARIVAAVDPQPGEHFVEIGPGRGALTRPLLERGVQLDVVEVDRELAETLRRDWTDPGLRVHGADALSFDYTALASGPRSLRLAANLPYNISTPLLFHLLAQAAVFRDFTVMLQREVVERMVAAPGTGDYGRLTVSLAARCRVEKLFLVRPGSFTPPPQVDSAVVRVVPEPERLLAITDVARFDALVSRAFTMRRKRLSNALKGVVEPAVFAATGIDPGLRPGDLSPAQYVALANAVANPSGAAATPV